MALAYAALAGAVVIWGLSFPVMKVAVTRLGPFDVGLFRILFGAIGSLGLLAWPLASSRPPFWITARRHALTLVLLSALVGYGQTFTLTYGLSLTPATIGSLIPPLNPICTMLLAACVLGEPVSRRQWIGMAVAVVGVVLLGFREGLPTWGTLKGPLVMAIAPTSWAVYTVMSKPLLREIAPMPLTAATLGGGFLLILPWADRGAVGRLLGASIADWGALLFLGLLAMALAYGLWYVGLARIGAASTGAVVLGIPLVGVISAWLFLGERIGPVVVVAGALILGGLHLVLGGREPRGSGPRPPGHRPKAVQRWGGGLGGGGRFRMRPSRG